MSKFNNLIQIKCIKNMLKCIKNMLKSIKNMLKLNKC